MSMKIAVHADDETNPTVQFAVSELRRHLVECTGRGVSVVPAGVGGPAIRVGVDRGIGGGPRAALRDGPGSGGGDDPELDDAVVIDVRGGDGSIVGRNPRSTLIAVYRYLRELGFRWLRPGLDGVVRPRLSGADFDRSVVRVVDKASHRHRGICIEGSVGLSQVIDLVDWLPKVGMNAYFVQFTDGAPFLRAWYERPEDPHADGSEFSATAAAAARARMVEAVRVRGLVFHAVGHGWTAAAAGIDSVGWNRLDGELDDATRAGLALVDEARDLWQRIPANTELCYSNPQVRARFAEVVTRYAAEHPEVDLLHIWLSDGVGNHCECGDCAARLPSEWYVMVLDEIDGRLSSAGLSVRLVVLGYHQLLWAPRSGMLNNPGRFSYMFAPISRDHREALPDRPTTKVMMPYPGNDYPAGIPLEDLLVSLRDWTDFHRGDSFDFDYHFMWQYCFDPGLVGLARIVATDVKHLAGLGLDGLISCQSQRTFLPDGMAVSLMAATLWDVDTDVESWIDGYYADAYGDRAAEVAAHLRALSDLAVEAQLNVRAPAAMRVTDDVVGRVRAEIDRFAMVEAPATDTDPVRSATWQHLRFHDRLWLRLFELFREVDAGGDVEGPCHRLAEFVFAEEYEHESVFDASNTLHTIRRHLRRRLAAQEGGARH